MALRFDFPNNAVLPSDERPLTRLSALREPLDVVYRGHVHGEQVAADVVDSGYCRILGRTAIGKSSVLPKILAKHTGHTVVVVTAQPLLARSGHKFFTENRDHVVSGEGLRVCHLQDQTTEIRDYDLVWASAAYMVAWMMKRSLEVPSADVLDGIIVMLDEAHEPDAYTHTVRSTARQMGAKSLALVSATFEPAGHSVNTTNVSIQKFRTDMPTSQWSVDQPGMPWHHGAIKTSALIFVEPHRDAERLVREYLSIGFLAHRLDSRTKAKDFDRAVADLTNNNAPPVVLIVDRTYRSGFNFDVDVVIDSGVIHYANGDGTEASITSREIYNVELVQTAGRAGRFGRKVPYYMPNIDPEWKICDIERVEMEAAALFIRLMGHLPVGNTADTIMTYDNIPKQHNLRNVINGPYPLPSYCRDEFGQRKSATREVNIPPIRIVPISRKTTVVSGGERVGVIPTRAQIDAALSVRSSVRPTCVTTVETKAPTKVSRAASTHVTKSVSGFSCLDREVPSLHLSRPVESSVCNIRPCDSVSNIGRTIVPSVAAGSVAKTVRVGTLINSSESTIEIPRDRGREKKISACSQVSNSVMTRTGNADDVWSVLAEQLCSPNTHTTPDNGAYMSCPGIDASKLPDVSRFFPDKEESVLKMAAEDNFKTTVKTLSSRHVKFGLHYAITRYNKLNLEIRSIKAAFERLVSGGYVVADFSRIRTEFSDTVSQVAAWEMEREALRGAIVDLAGKIYSLVEVKTVKSAETERTELYVKKFQKQLAKTNRLSDQAAQDIMHSAREEPLMLKHSGDSTAIDRRKGSRRRDSSVARETIYIKPAIGVSSIVDRHDGKIKVRPSKMVRKFTGCDSFVLSDVKCT